MNCDKTLPTDFTLSTKHGGWLKHAETKLFSNELTVFYQICRFKNINGKHNVRKLTYYDPTKIISKQEFEINTLTVQRFLATFRPEQYKIYSAYDLDTEEAVPQLGELFKAQSTILNSQNKIEDYGHNYSSVPYISDRVSDNVPSYNKN